MFERNKISSSERSRVFDFLIFKIKHGGNIVNALKSYMDNNKTKSSRPIQTMLDRITGNGEAFIDVALEFGLIDRYGHLILSSSVEPAKALPVIRDKTFSTNFGVTSIIVSEVLKKWAVSLLFGMLLVLDVTRQPLNSIFEKMNAAAASAGAKPEPLPAYLANPWLVANWVIGVGIVIALMAAGLWWVNRYKTGTMYRFAKFRFYEDWVGLLDLYLAFKAAGQSDYKVALSLASACPPGGFTANLFTDMAESMKKNGHSFYEVLAVHETAFPAEVLSFFLDASKTGQVDAYMTQAKAYCSHRLVAITEATKIWVPALTGVVLLLTFGLIVADMFVSITMVSMKPITG